MSTALSVKLNEWSRLHVSNKALQWARRTYKFDKGPVMHVSMRPRIKVKEGRKTEDRGWIVTMEDPAGGLVVVIQDPETSPIPSRHFGVGLDPKIDLIARGQGKIPDTQQFVYPEEAGQLLKVMFDRFIWPMAHSDPETARSFLEELRASADEGQTLYDAFQERWTAYHEASRLIAEQLVDNIVPGEIIFLHDKHMVLVAKHIKEIMIERGIPLDSVSVNWFDHTPWPALEIVEESFDSNEKDSRLRTDCMPMVMRDMYESLDTCDTVTFQVDEYADRFEVGHEYIMGKYDRSQKRPFVGAMHVHIDSEEIKPPAEDEDLSDLRKDPEFLLGQQTIEEIERVIETQTGLEPFVMMWSGRIDPEKGPLEALEGFQEFLRQNQHDPAMLQRVHLYMRMPWSRDYGEFEARLFDKIGETIELHESLCAKHGVKPPLKVVSTTFTSVTQDVETDPVSDRSRKRGLGELSRAKFRFFTSHADGWNITAAEAAYVGGDGVIGIGEHMGIAFHSASEWWLHFDPSRPTEIARAMRNATRMGLNEMRTRMKNSVERLGIQHPKIWQQKMIEHASNVAHFNRAAALTLEEQNPGILQTLGGNSATNEAR